MTDFIVDTNVPLVANELHEQADDLCLQTCISKLNYLMNQGTVAVDDKDAILKEYVDRLGRSDGRGIGDRFFIHVIRNQYVESRVRRIRVTPIADDRRGYDELPENTFDRSDRKFLVVAAVSNGVVLNATDSDWHEHPKLIDELGVEVEQLCPNALKGYSRDVSRC